MKRVVYSTSTSCLDYLKKPHAVRAIPQHLIINGVRFLDGKNITLSRLEEILATSTMTDMRTEPATHAEILAIFNQLEAEGYHEVLMLTHSFQLSESFNIIREAKSQFQGKLRVFVMDTKQINVAQGMVALDLAQMFLAGAMIPEIQHHLDTLAEAQQALFVVDDLSYLIKSKRLKPTAGFIANLFDIKPVLSIEKDGAIRPVDKVRKFERAIDMMVKKLAPSLQSQPNFPFIYNAGNPDLVNYLRAVLARDIGITDIAVVPVSPVSVATHGPNAVGLGMFSGVVPNCASMITTDAFY